MRESKNRQENEVANPEGDKYTDSHGKFRKGQEVAVIRSNEAMERGWKLLTYNKETKKWSAFKEKSKKDEKTGEVIPKTQLRSFGENEIGELFEGTPEL